MMGSSTVTIPTVCRDSPCGGGSRMLGWRWLGLIFTPASADGAVTFSTFSSATALFISASRYRRLPAALETVAQQNSGAVHDDQEAEQHDDGTGGAFHEGALRDVGPQEDLHRQDGGRIE